MPVLLTAIKELNEPRMMNIRDIFSSAKSQIQVWTAKDLEIDPSHLGLLGSPTKVKKSMTKEGKGGGEIIKQSPKDAAQYLIGKLKEKKFI